MVFEDWIGKSEFESELILMLILMEGIVLCFILLMFCVIGIANGPEKFTVFYEKNVQEKAIKLQQKGYWGLLMV